MSDVVGFAEGVDEFDPAVAAAIEEKLYEEKVDVSDRIVGHMRRTKETYTRVFKEGNASKEDVDFLMRDLAWFCKAFDMQWDSDPRQQDRNVARREVFMRIAEYAGLDMETLMKTYLRNQNGK